MRYQGDTSTDPRPDFTALFREPAVEVLGYHRGTMDFEKVVKHVTATIPRGRTYRLLTIDLCEGGEHCLTHPFNFDSLQGTSRQ